MSLCASAQEKAYLCGCADGAGCSALQASVRSVLCGILESMAPVPDSAALAAGYGITMVVHVNYHYFFTYRALYLTVTAVIIYMIEVVDWKMVRKYLPFGKG